MKLHHTHDITRNTFLPSHVTHKVRGNYMNEYKRAPIQSYENEMRYDIFVS